MVMGTSGYLLDQTMAKKCKEAGIKAVAISIDSADPSVHDAFRGREGVWERAVDAVRFCRDEDIGVQINMSVMQSAMSDVREVIEVGTALGVRDYHIFFPYRPEAYWIEPGSAKDYEDLIRGFCLSTRVQ